MQSAKKMKALSVLSMAVAATMGAKAHAATLTLYYDNIVELNSSGGVVQSYGYGLATNADFGATQDPNYADIPTSINIAKGDTLEFGIDAVVTNNVNPDAGKKTGGLTVAQPSYLGLSTLSIVVPSTDTNASKLTPNTFGAPVNTFGGQPSYNSTASLNNNNGSPPNSAFGPNNNPSGVINGVSNTPVWADSNQGDVNPTGTDGHAGDVGDHFATFQGNGAEPNNKNGIAAISQYGAKTASYATATDFFDSLAYTANGTGTVTLSPSVHTAGTSYWTRTLPGTTSTASGYLAQEFVLPGDSVGTLPVLVINITGGVTSHAIVSLTSASGPAPTLYGSQEGTLHITGSNGSYTHDQVTGLTSSTGYVEASTFSPPTDTEVYGVDVTDASGQATSAELAAVVAAIGGDGIAPASTGIAASSSVSGSNPYGFSNNYNLYLVAAPGVDSSDFLGLDLSNGNDSNLNGLTFSAVAVVPEPMSLGLLAMGGLGLMSRRRHRKV